MMKKVLSSVAVAVLVSFSAAALTVADVNVQPAHPGEWELLDIYEAIFGVSTGFTTSDALYQAVGVDPDDYNGPDVFHFFGGQNVALEARYATYNHSLYYYDPVLPGAVENENFLFTVTGGYVNPGAGGSPAAQLIASIEPYGFSLHVGQTGATLYSEYGRNEAERVQMLMLAAPQGYEPGTYLLAWEDRLAGDPRADWDYQDLVILVRPIVPEPTSIALMGLGIAALSLRGLRKLV
ncbi:MAG TPA: PEP-CTERM sorting domain-containing protein [Candidatus Hydrogenedentes bacterium]|nr:PEP-CTERM sorting domain-containing protein [Candidatus Hydrogenedentota bacterium]HPJ98273.1 PEP-CTERM sorting domain-containing protein [Candidatus Hydrogenedentota bacterium]